CQPPNRSALGPRPSGRKLSP
ncbi:MAG: hypothetical protein AVDCRST_MAG18-1636, partial [uncultured Thermomicrobiales bacterium]